MRRFKRKRLYLAILAVMGEAIDKNTVFKNKKDKKPINHQKINFPYYIER